MILVVCIQILLYLALGLFTLFRAVVLTCIWNLLPELVLVTEWTLYVANSRLKMSWLLIILLPSSSSPLLPAYFNITCERMWKYFKQFENAVMSWNCCSMLMSSISYPNANFDLLKVLGTKHKMCQATNQPRWDKYFWLTYIAHETSTE